MSSDTLNKLFPTPRALANPMAPRPYASPTPALVEKVLELLKDNHEKYHCFFNDKGFHNHMSHHLLALYYLGASPEVMEKWYRNDCSYQRNQFDPPEPITDSNVFDHVGDENFYKGYKMFFEKAILEKGSAAVLEEYVFSNKANVGDGKKEGPMALCRFLSALVHPMIHTGHGFEFGLPGMVVEGLSQTFVHKTKNDLPLVPPAMFGSASTIGKLTSSIQSSLSFSAKNEDIRAFTIMSRMLKDSRWDNFKKDHDLMYGPTIEKYGDAIYEYSKEWSVDTTKEGELDRKMGEIIWMNVAIYAIGGWKKGEELNNDFFFMHLVTSSIFLSSLLQHLNSSSQEHLLRGFFTISLAWWVARGRPNLKIAEFYQNTTYLSPADNSDGNPWFPILRTTILHSDDHLSKIQRTLAHYSSSPVLGGMTAGSGAFKDTGLEGTELLDGSLFLRAARLTREAMGGEGVGAEKGWKRSGFFAE